MRKLTMLLVLIVLLFLTIPVFAECDYAVDSTAYDDGSGGSWCWLTGPGCWYCWNTGAGTGCARNNAPCVPIYFPSGQNRLAPNNDDRSRLACVPKRNDTKRPQLTIDELL